MTSKNGTVDPLTFDNRDFTRACDLIRGLADPKENGIDAKLSRSEASRIRMKISEVLGLDDMMVAKKLADHYKSLGNV